MIGRLSRVGTSLLPFIIIGGLLYAALFIKPKVLGESLAPPPIATRDAFYDVAAPKPGSIWTVGRGGKILRRDGDASAWVEQSSGTLQNLQSMVVWSEREALVVGNASTVLHTIDGGAHWQPVQLAPATEGPGPKLLRVRRFGEDGALAVGEFGLVAVSRDRGVHWSVVAPRKDVAWNDVAVTDKAWLIVGEFGRIKRSQDEGRSWDDIVSPVKTSLNAVAIRNDGHGIAVGLDGVVLGTSDGGRSWALQTGVTKAHLFDVKADGDGWLVAADQGLMLRSADGVQWQSKRLSERNYAWHTAIVSDGPRLILAGKGLGVLDASGSYKNIQ